MSYQVLARKWRPQTFEQLMGQEHVVTVLVNALSQQRLHHAYLFTGTRGVGKTTIARIFAKSLNCEIGITAKPCGQCDTCLEIEQGRFVDLLEIDAASKTKVDDTREILDNVQYAPTRGRYKVYLIDEVHMLSRHSFNALLKTLEEPPEHVKFILATTDPQKLPVTVLSRCLQFHLKALTVSQIETKLCEILLQEQVSHDEGTLTLLAKAARGSMRDSLSLTDQAIAQGQGNINLVNIQQMLGSLDQNWIYKIVIALLKQDGGALMALSQEIASCAPSYSRLFAELIQLFHQIAIVQIVDQHFDLAPEHAQLLKKFSQSMSAEDVQLYYQICVNGRKDLPYASDEQAAFDMTLLRLFAFKPMHKEQLKSIEASAKDNLPSAAIEFDELLPVEKNIAAQGQSIEQAQTREAINTHSQDMIEANSSLEQLGKQSVSTPEAINTHSQDMIEANSSLEQLGKQSISTPETINIHSQDMIEANSSLEQLGKQSISTPETINTHSQDMIEANSSLEQLVNESDTNHERKFAQQKPSVDKALTSEKINIHSQDIVEANASLGELVSQSANDQEKSGIKHEQALAQQAEAIEQQAAQLKGNEGEGQQHEISSKASEVEKPAFDSPVSNVLATRNMLRSRKKQLEKQEKKPSDAKQRPSPSGESNTTVDDSIDLENKKVELPKPEQPYQAESIDPATIRKANQVDQWAHMIDSMELIARLRQLAIHATIEESSTEDNLILQLDQATKHLYTETAQQQLQQTISQYLSRDVKVTINIVEQTIADPYQIQSHINDKRYDYAKELLKTDEIVLALQQNFQASLDEESISAI